MTTPLPVLPSGSLAPFSLLVCVPAPQAANHSCPERRGAPPQRGPSSQAASRTASALGTRPCTCPLMTDGFGALSSRSIDPGSTWSLTTATNVTKRDMRSRRSSCTRPRTSTTRASGAPRSARSIPSTSPVGSAACSGTSTASAPSRQARGTAPTRRWAPLGSPSSTMRRSARG